MYNLEIGHTLDDITWYCFLIVEKRIYLAKVNKTKSTLFQNLKCLKVIEWIHMKKESIKLGFLLLD